MRSGGFQLSRPLRPNDADAATSSRANHLSISGEETTTHGYIGGLMRLQTRPGAELQLP